MGASRKHPAVRVTLALVLVAFLAACSSSGSAGQGAEQAQAPGGGTGGSAAYAPLGAGDEPPPWQRQGGGGETAIIGGATTAQGARSAPSRPQAAPPQPTGAQIRVEWEALAVERDRCANPRFRRQPTRGTLTMQKVVVVSNSHPDSKKSRLSGTSRGDRGVAVGALADKDMEVFVQGLQRRGFFQLARPTSSVQHLFDDETARGRITVEVGGESRTLLSMRGQGLNESTKRIPALYSEVKQAVIQLRNQTSTLTVIGMGRDPMSR